MIEALKCFSIIVIVFFGTYIASNYPLIASFVIGIGMQQSGWLGHDYAHGRGSGCLYLNKFFSQLIIGLSTEWWSHKHNTHHCFPNRLEIDADIHNEPILHLWFPPEEKDVWYRKF
jgi:fatty acid desaturase